MEITLYVATTNPGKLRDFEEVSRSCTTTFCFLPLPGLLEISPPAEDADTFEENARSKAIAYSRHAHGNIVLADDSGLEVDALGRAPGVRSARYADDVGFVPGGPYNLSPDDRNNLLLMQNLRDVPTGQRSARYRCVLAAARDGKCISTGHGTVEGIILEVPRGHAGFGYDPLFYLPQLDRTMAEIDLKTKLEISHRGNALRALLRELQI